MKDQFIDTLRLVGLTVLFAGSPPACSDTEDPRDNFEMNQSGYDTTECYLQKTDTGTFVRVPGVSVELLCLCGCHLSTLVVIKKDEYSSGISDLWQVTRAEFRSS